MAKPKTISEKAAKENKTQKEPENQEKSGKDNTKEKVKANIIEQQVITEISNQARLLYDQSRFGSMSHNHVQLSLIEALYLLDKDKIEILDGRNNPLTRTKFVKKALKIEPSFLVRYSVFKDLRDRGYIVKTALKFGADFRVYDRGVKPGDDHAKWIVFPVHEASILTWHDFSAKNRVAHSTKKHLLIGVVDGEGDCTYYEIKWIRP